MRQKLSIVIFILAGVVIGILIWLISSLTVTDLIKKAEKIETTIFTQPPIFVGFKNIELPDTSAQVFALTIHDEKLLVSFLNSDCIQEYSSSLELIRNICLLNGESASITGIVVEGDRLYAANYRTGELHQADYKTGTLINSFGLFPDQRTSMKLFGVAYRSDAIYVSDSRTNQILAISAIAVPDLKDEDELLLSFPSAEVKDFQLSFPTFLAITPDGRLLVSDVGNKEVKAFTCSGRPAHLFEKGGEAKFAAPMGIAFDNVPSPELIALKDSVFEPSDVYEQGRIHIVDTKLAKVKVFNALGKYVLTYGEELEQPNGIAIDQTRRLIFVADAKRNGVGLYKY
ncbi:MAG: hypothetical protein QME58_09480 [Bacteroidota bacterium]|nr:hypothetical protein [Bacteroidota bacterium]